MSILAMRRLRAITAKEERKSLLRDLSKLGCLEISEPSGELCERLQGFRGESEAQVRGQLQELVAAMNVVQTHAKVKRGMFAPRIEITEQTVFSEAALEAAGKVAGKINALAQKLQQNYAEEGRLQNRRASLAPWKDLSVPLGLSSGKYYVAQFGVVPAQKEFALIEQAAISAAPDAELRRVSGDNEQQYLFFVCHRDDFDALSECLREFGYSKVRFQNAEKTAAEEISALDGKLKALSDERAQVVQEIIGFQNEMETLEVAHDSLQTKLAQETATAQMLATETTVLVEGWVPACEEEKLIKCLEKHGCAYELREPLDEEEPPILRKNHKLVEPFGMITDMYSPPAYRGIDPNPFVAVFFSLFFGLMFSDAGYGLLMLLAVLFFKWKFKPKGTMGTVVTIAFFCSVTTFVWGALFGGWFGNAIPAIYELVTGTSYSKTIALWFDPLADPMTMLIFSFILGAVHIFTGMAIKGYMLIREGKVWDAIFDIGFWWVFLAGIVMFLLGAPGGAYVLGAGALGLILTQGRSKKNIFMKLVSGIGSLYDVTGFLGDILSYSRLLALSLATAVIAQVVNTMGTLTGPIGFIFVFLIGQTFNIAVSLIGTFVHTSRLQYVEFFGKFYEGGGVKFAPLKIQTKYVDIVKEEQ